MPGLRDAEIFKTSPAFLQLPFRRGIVEGLKHLEAHCHFYLCRVAILSQTQPSYRPWHVYSYCRQAWLAEPGHKWPFTYAWKRQFIIVFAMLHTYNWLSHICVFKVSFARKNIKPLKSPMKGTAIVLLECPPDQFPFVWHSPSWPAVFQLWIILIAFFAGCIFSVSQVLF